MPASGLEELVEGVDYFVEDGLVVFTEAHLRRRGTCCDSGCRHCPWRPRGDGPAGDPPASGRPLDGSGDEGL